MTVHPALLARYKHLRRLHRSIGEPGELTAIRELRALDPHGLLSLAEELSGEMVRRAMEEARTEAMLTLITTQQEGRP